MSTFTEVPPRITRRKARLTISRAPSRYVQRVIIRFITEVFEGNIAYLSFPGPIGNRPSTVLIWTNVSFRSSLTVTA